jgi:hypothetical protein
MTISPPDVPYAKRVPKLVRSVSQSRSGKRLISFVEYADPYWQFDIVTVGFDANDRPAMEAFLEDAGNGMRTVLWSVGVWGIPQAYASDPGNAALADGSLTSVTNGYQIAVGSVTNGLDIRRGDLIGMVDGANRSMHRVMTGAVAASGSIVLTVEPAIPGYISAGATVNFKDLALNTRMVPGSNSITDDYLPVATFTLVEVPQ